MRLAAQIMKEIQSYFRDPSQRIALFGPPLIQLFVLSSAATLEVSNVDIAVFNEDAGAASHEVIERVKAAHFVGEVVFVDRQDSITQLIDERKVLAGVHFPQDFSRDVAAGRPAAFQALIDGRRANAGQITLSYLQTIAADYGADVIGEKGTSSAAAPQVEVRHWFNENLLYTWFFVPGMMGVLVMFNALVSCATSIAKERENGTFDQLLVSPSTPLEIVIAKSVPAFVAGTVLASMMIAFCVYAFGIPLLGSLPLLMGCMMLFIFAMVGIGLMLSSVCGTQQQAILGAFAIGYPMLLTSGFATPYANMPHWLQIVAQVSPMKHFLIIIQGSFAKAMPPSDILANAWPLVVIATVSMSLAMVIVKRKLQ
jgi:ABC-2 type transport system permease protein